MIVDLLEPLYSYDKLLTDAKRLATQYENLIQYVTIGNSHDNRDIILLKLGFGKKHFICCTGVHGRETINPIVIMKMIEYYAELYTNHKKNEEELRRQLNVPTKDLESEYEQLVFCTCIYELLNTFTILFIPLLNPDGYMIALNGFDTIRNISLRKKCKDMNIPYEEWKYNARGVDINRNFPSRLWKPKHTADYAGSENETKALIHVFHKYRSKGFLDVHSRGREIYYYRNMMSEEYNKRQLFIAKRLKITTGYELVPPQLEVDPNDTGGNTVHYFSEVFNRPALTIETVEDEATFPMDNSYRSITFDEIKLLIFEFASLII